MNQWELIGSEIIDYEISKIPNKERKKKVKNLTVDITIKQKLTPELINRAKGISEKGIKGLDALHVASAEFLKSSYMLTTDQNIIKKYSSNLDFFPNIKICNPLLFLTEML